jgi:hypothetical protein
MNKKWQYTDKIPILQRVVTERKHFIIETREAVLVFQERFCFVIFGFCLQSCRSVLFDCRPTVGMVRVIATHI